jgi:hypothetical protein
MNPLEKYLMPTTSSSRRDFLSRTALSAGVTLGAIALARPALAQTAATPATETTPAPPVTAPGDIEILNFALGLERLEAAFYAQIQGAQGNRAYLSPRQLEAAQAIGASEIAHVSALEAAILAAGGTLAPVATFRFPANVFISPVAFSWFGYTLEEIGIGAYLGAVGAIQSRDLRRAAASIYGSEVRHAALLRSFGGFTFAPRYFESPLTVAQVQTLVAPYIA